MNILQLISLGLTTYFLIDNLNKINYNFTNLLTLFNFINIGCIFFFYFYYNQYLLIPIIITSLNLGTQIIKSHPLYNFNLPDTNNQLLIYAFVISYLIFNFFRGLLNVVTIIIHQ